LVVLSLVASCVAAGPIPNSSTALPLSDEPFFLGLCKSGFLAGKRLEKKLTGIRVNDAIVPVHYERRINTAWLGPSVSGSYSTTPLAE
jgi:hypothetical protein